MTSNPCASGGRRAGVMLLESGKCLSHGGTILIVKIGSVGRHVNGVFSGGATSSSMEDKKRKL